MDRQAQHFDVTVFGAHGENAARYLTKGRGVAIDGRLDRREWQTQDGSKRQAIQINRRHRAVPRHTTTCTQRPAHNRAHSTAVSSDDIPF
jgi:single-stranded DNA-binding protein